METCNKIHLLLLVCLSFNLISVRATCAPRSFRYLEPKQASPSSFPVPPTPTSSPPPSVPKPAPPPISNPVVPPSPPKPATPVPTPAAPVKQQATPAPATPPQAPVKQQATPAPATPLPAPQQKQATPAAATPPPTPQQEVTPAAATPPPTQTQQVPPPTAKPAPVLPITNPLGALGQVHTEVRRVCDATDNPLLCLNTVSPLLQGKFDLVSILETEVKACKNQGQTLLDKSTKISADPATVTDVAKTLKICKENYESLLDNMDATLKAIGEKDLGTVNTMLSAAISDVSTCGENFSEVAIHPNPLSDMEQLVINLVSNCLSISSSLKW